MIGIYLSIDKVSLKAQTHCTLTAARGMLRMYQETGDRKYLDGALADSIPVRFFESMGYDRNLVILTQPLGFRKKPDPMLPLMKLVYRKYPNLVSSMITRHQQYNDTLDYIARREAAGELLVIRPQEKLPIGRTEKDPEKLRLVYEIGRRTALERIGQIRQFLSAP